MTRVAIAAPSSEAAEAGMAVAQCGGNALDAATAAIITATVTEFGMVGPMGGAFVNVWAPGQEPVVVDGYVEMPGREREPQRFGGGLLPFTFDYFGETTLYGGPGSVATPGMFAALDHAHRRWGALPWPELVAPAVQVARHGYPVGPAAAFWLARSGPHLFGWDSSTVAFLRQGPGGSLPVAGQVMRYPDLANTLDIIGREGVSTLYTGDIARAICADMDARGGLLGLADLAAYQVRERRPLRARVGDFDVATNPSPSIGGPVLAALLRTLQQRGGGGPVDAGEIIAALRLVLGYRWAVVDPAEDLQAAADELIATLTEQGPDGLAMVSSSPDTVHVSAVDATGLAVSITTSCGYCSGYTTPGTGLMFNNALGEQELNRRGFHVLAPGTRLASNMAPTTARGGDGSALAVGSPGADRITTALSQTLAAMVFNGASLEEAVLHPRIHLSQTDSGMRLDVEADPGAQEAARATGLEVVVHEGLTMYFGGVGAARRSPDGTLDAVGDPRRAAAVAIGP